MLKNKIFIVTALYSLLLASGQNTRADILFFSFNDPFYDQTGTIDVIKMDFTFNNTTGDYEIVLTTDARHPFKGDFRININLFNPDTGTTADDPSLFQDTFNDYHLTSAIYTITLIGTNSRLTSWKSGDRVATTHLPFGNPDGSTAFRTSVGDFPLQSWGEDEDIIAEGEYKTIVPVPVVSPAEKEWPLDGAWIASAPTPMGNMILKTIYIAQDSAKTQFTVELEQINWWPLLSDIYPEVDEIKFGGGQVVKTGLNTYEGTNIEYFIKKADRGIGEIVGISIIVGTLELTGPDVAQGQGTGAYYLAEQDADVDGFPDEGQEPVLCLPWSYTKKRLKMMTPCVPTPLP
jgi:hypothetical protein